VIRLYATQWRSVSRIHLLPAPELLEFVEDKFYNPDANSFSLFEKILMQAD
jgi:hypothetical protein